MHPKTAKTAGSGSWHRRQQQTNSNAIVSESVNFGVLGTTAFFASCTSGVPFEFIWDENQEIALPPGSQVTIAADQLVDVIIVSFMWRGRPGEDKEKNGVLRTLGSLLSYAPSPVSCVFWQGGVARL